MPGFTDSVSLFNSLLRTLLAVVVVAAVGAAGWYGYTTVNAGKNEAREQAARLQTVQRELESKDQLLEQHERRMAKQAEELRELSLELQEKEQEIIRLNTANRLLKMQYRVAELSVIDQRTDPETGKTISEIEFVEVNEEGHALEEPRTFELEGDMVYVDNWVVKFEDEYVEQAKLDRATSICMFRRIFGEHQRPITGFQLDEVGSHPNSYSRGGQISEFEQKIWNDFWTIANDEQKAREMGIRAAHGEAVSIRVQKGKRYKVELRASDGLSITPDGEI